MKSRKFLLAALFLVGLFSFSAFAQNSENGSEKVEIPKSRSVSKVIDTSAFDKKIAEAETEFKANPKDLKAKNLLADAYAERAFALVEAAQYRSSIGDFRRCLKLNPKHKEAQVMYDQIINIYEAIGRELPKEGEEPAPLPYKKEQ